MKIIMKIDLKTIDRQKSKTKKSVNLRGIDAPKKYEKDMRVFVRFMINQMRKRFENQVLASMNVSTVEKFQDAQIGNYSIILRGLSKKFEKMIKKQFSEERIRKFVKHLYSQTNSYNQSNYYKTVSNNLGIDLDKILLTDGLNSFVNAKTLESTDMIQKLRDETIAAYKQNINRRMSAGASLADLYKQLKKDTGLKLKNGDLIARNELKAFNAELTKKRALNTGATRAIWMTAKDERVRSCHSQLDGQEFEIGKGLKCSGSDEYIEPGEAINCRCVARTIIEFEE